MIKTKLTEWLITQKATIETIVLEAAELFVQEHKENKNFGYDLQCSQEEAYNLVNSQDLCYDRYTTPLAYTLWYQARRLNVFITHFLDKIIEACTAGRPVEIFDLGAGTGCVQLSFGIVCVGLKRLEKANAQIRIINVDSSPFMLSYLQKYLWPIAQKHYGELQNFPVEYHVNSWSNNTGLSITNPWICASYLFDSTDNEEYLISNFNELIRGFAPAKILMLSSAQDKKKRLMKSLSDNLKSKEYISVASSNSNWIFNGELSRVTSLRRTLINQYQLRASSYAVTWSDNSFTSIGLEKKQEGFAFDIRTVPEGLQIFNPPLRIRREVTLNDAQIKAAQFETRPSIITGPAGCGKSIVVTEKIINVCEQYAWNTPISILVTTFNKSLLKQLREWITDLLNEKGKSCLQNYYKWTNGNNDGTGELKTGVDNQISIKFIHFEMLGSYVGCINFTPFNEDSHKAKLEAIILDIRKELSIASQDYLDVLTPSFLLEEYHRVIYGLQCRINLGEEEYQSLLRIGRGNKPKLERGQKRKVVWTALSKYAHWMHNYSQAGQSYLARRQLLYNKLVERQVPNLFDYVFVDEFQDCTRTDLKIMSLLLKNIDNLILAGDLAQAVHIGQAGMIPKEGDMSMRKIHRLKGSYRLPFRICEAIYPLSQELLRVSSDKDITAEITPYKGAPPGSRPIVVFAENDSSLAAKIVSIKRLYSVFGLGRITVMEKDHELCSKLNSLDWNVETTTILRLKGLEKEFVVWSLQANIEYEREVMEFAYTIMTRTNCIVVIALSPQRKELYLPILKHLRTDRLIYWDDCSEKEFKKAASFISSVVPA